MCNFYFVSLLYISYCLLICGFYIRKLFKTCWIHPHCYTVNGLEFNLFVICSEHPLSGNTFRNLQHCVLPIDTLFRSILVTAMYSVFSCFALMKDTKQGYLSFWLYMYFSFITTWCCLSVCLLCVSAYDGLPTIEVFSLPGGSFSHTNRFDEILTGECIIKTLRIWTVTFFTNFGWFKHYFSNGKLQTTLTDSTF